MGRTDTAVTPADPDATDQAPLVIRPDLRAELERLLEAVPESGGEAWDNILSALVEAGDPFDLDAPWRSEGLKTYRNERIIVRDLRRMPSSFNGGLGFYLVLDIAIVSTGELATTTSSSLGVVVQLLKAFDMGALPLEVIPRIAEKPSRNGFYPIHLEVVR